MLCDCSIVRILFPSAISHYGLHLDFWLNRVPVQPPSLLVSLHNPELTPGGARLPRLCLQQARRRHVENQAGNAHPQKCP